MSRLLKHPLLPGVTVFPRIWVNSPRRGLHQDIEGKATIMGPSDKAHHYMVTFGGETEACERGPLDEFSMREELAL